MLAAVAFCQPHPRRYTRLHPGEVSGCALAEIIGQIAFHNIGKIAHHTVSPGEGESRFHGNIHQLDLRQLFSQFLIGVGIDLRTGHSVLRGFHRPCGVFQSVVANTLENRADIQVAIHFGFADQNPEAFIHSCQRCLEEVQSFCAFDLYRREPGLIGMSLQNCSGGNLRSPQGGSGGELYGRFIVGHRQGAVSAVPL